MVCLNLVAIYSHVLPTLQFLKQCIQALSNQPRPSHNTHSVLLISFRLYTPSSFEHSIHVPSRFFCHVRRRCQETTYKTHEIIYLLDSHKDLLKLRLINSNFDRRRHQRDYKGISVFYIKNIAVLHPRFQITQGKIYVLF